MLIIEPIVVNDSVLTTSNVAKSDQRGLAMKMIEDQSLETQES